MAQEMKKNAPVEKALEALKTYDWGSDIAALEPIDQAVSAAFGNQAARKELETRLAGVLKTGAPRAAKEFVCRKLALIGTAQSVPVLAGLLADGDLGHMARYALERIPGPEADKALREALTKVEGRNKIGLVHSLAVRKDSSSATRLATLLGSREPELAAAAAFALGRIGTLEAAKALEAFHRKVPEQLRAAAAGASLECAERLLAQGKRTQALGLLRMLASQEHLPHVRLAAKNALSAATRDMSKVGTWPVTRAPGASTPSLTEAGAELDILLVPAPSLGLAPLAKRPSHRVYGQT